MRTVLSTTFRSRIAVNGTDFPAEVVLSRWAPPSGRPTFTAALVCNGVAYDSRDFRTLREAREHGAALMGIDGRRTVQAAAE